MFAMTETQPHCPHMWFCQLYGVIQTFKIRIDRALKLSKTYSGVSVAVKLEVITFRGTDRKVTGPSGSDLGWRCSREQVNLSLYVYAEPRAG